MKTDSMNPHQNTMIFFTDIENIQTLYGIAKTKTKQP
jgi:hypothetical protein